MNSSNKKMNELDTVPDGGVTLAQMAKVLGVSKESLRKKLVRDESLKQTMDRCIWFVNGTKYIDKIGQEILKTAYKVDGKSSVESMDTVDNVHGQDMDIGKNVHGQTMDMNENVHGQGMDTVINVLQAQLSAKDALMVTKWITVGEGSEYL